MAEEPDFVLPLVPGAAARLTLTRRDRPWHLRLSGQDVFIAVETVTADPGIPEPGAENAMTRTADAESGPDLDPEPEGLPG